MIGGDRPDEAIDRIVDLPALRLLPLEAACEDVFAFDGGIWTSFLEIVTPACVE